MTKAKNIHLPITKTLESDKFQTLTSYPVKANYLLHIAPSWNGSRISTDCQQKLILSAHDTGGRFLLVTSWRKKRGQHEEITC